jgi:arsenate reductase (thioredoxin)
MAEGLLWYDGGERFEVASAGTQPSCVRPEAMAVMRELGMDISGQRSKSVEAFLGQDFDEVEMRRVRWLWGGRPIVSVWSGSRR